MTFSINLNDIIHVEENICITKLKVCSNIYLRNIFISDIYYDI
jgi:hypothetical protein